MRTQVPRRGNSMKDQAFSRSQASAPLFLTVEIDIGEQCKLKSMVLLHPYSVRFKDRLKQVTHLQSANYRKCITEGRV